ncbi:MAG: AraC family transcriptional regulator [Verrucomicrobiota bacterium]
MNNKAPFISDQVSVGEYYYLNLTPEIGIREAIVCGGREQCMPDYRIERRGFKFMSIEFVSTGKGSLTLCGKTSPLQPGALFFYGPGIPHTIETDSDAPMLKHFVDFVGSNLVGLIKKTDISSAPVYAPNILRIRTIFDSLLQTGKEETRHRDELCVLLLKQLILTINEAAYSQQEAFSPAWQTYLRCRDHIEQSFQSLRSVGQIADECSLAEEYLCRLFQRYANETPLQLLTRLKMNQAVELLSHSGLLVKQVAEETGYPDPYHFSRVFKRIYGIPPETFRQTSRRTE